MKKIFLRLFLFIFLMISAVIVILSTIGIETNKFNEIISEKVNETNNIKLELATIKFKLDPKELSLFLETKNPKINYRNISIPVQYLKTYIDFLSVFKSKPNIKKINLKLEELDVSQFNKLSILIKPSTFKSFLNNKLKEGKLVSEIEIYLNDKGTLKNFIAKGSVRDLSAELLNDIRLINTSLNFFADRNDILIKNIIGNIEDIKISDGDLKFNFENGIKINSNFNSKINIDEKFFNRHSKYLTKNFAKGTIKKLNANLENTFFIDFDKTYKVSDYKYSISGKLEKSEIELLKSIKNNFLQNEIKDIQLSNIQLKTVFSPKLISVKGIGKYSLNNLDFLKLDFDHQIKKNFWNLKLDSELKNNFEIGVINYKKSSNSLANLFLNLEKTKNGFFIKNLDFLEGDNFIKLNELRFKKNNLQSFKKISVKTEHNDFLVSKNGKILIKGNKFDASNLVKFFKNTNKDNKFKNINSKIEIDFKNTKVPMSKKLSNFKLIGDIKDGKFTKISAKGDFGNNQFLDISMKKDKHSNKKYLEIYSDLTRPLLTEYNFFKGLSGGKLLFTSTIVEKSSNSNLKIENFKVADAPGLVKLLSLADLGGLADLAEGEGITFDILEIDMQQNRDIIKLNEIIALGPSMSVLMEGYQNKGITSLRGTLVPAKTLNKIISKIPLIGNIIIPKEAGEGLFGVSFKMKGPKGELKTTINPIRTLTPRFIQKMIDKKKEAK